MIRSLEIEENHNTFDTYYMGVPFVVQDTEKHGGKYLNIGKKYFMDTNLIFIKDKNGVTRLHIPIHQNIELDSHKIHCPNYAKYYNESFNNIMGRDFSENEKRDILKEHSILFSAEYVSIGCRNGLETIEKPYRIFNPHIKEFEIIFNPEGFRNYDYLTTVDVREGEELFVFEVIIPFDKPEDLRENFGIYFNDCYTFSLEGDNSTFRKLDLHKDEYKEHLSIAFENNEEFDVRFPYIIMKHEIILSERGYEGYAKM